MPAVRLRLAFLATLALLLTACGSRTKTTAPPPAAPSTPVVTSSPAPAVSGPMTGPELLWLDGIGALHKSMDKVVTDSPTALTTAAMHSLAQQLGNCTTALTGLGAFTDRLQPVYDLAKQGCGQYQKAATCFETAAKLGIVVGGSANDKKQRKAIDCGFAAPGDGSKFFAEAEGKGFEIQAAAHR